MSFAGFLLVLIVVLVVLSMREPGPRRLNPRQYHQQVRHSTQQGFGAPTDGGAPWDSSQRTAQVDPVAAIKEVDSDITTFGDELRDLDLEVVGHQLDTAARQDYQRALDAYEDAKDSLAQVRNPAEISHVTSILEDGRYAISCVKARVAGEPLPVKRPPCFFNPAHGPSTQNVTWSPEMGSPREVPACAADAERVLAGAEPCIRTVSAGPARIPYWQDPAYASYAQGYYSNWQSDQVVKGLAIGTAAFIGLAALPHALGAVEDVLDNIFDDFDF